MKKYIVIFILCAGAFSLLASGVCFSAKAVSPRYVKFDKSEKIILKPGNFEVVVIPGSSPTARYAASFLADTLGRTFGVKVPVVKKSSGRIALHVGDKNLASQWGLDVSKLDRDGFYIRSGKNKILMIGRDDRSITPAANGGYFERATLFAVQEFLERFAGVRFYFPGEIGTVIPEKKEIVLNSVDLADRPDMQHRSFYIVPWKPIMEGQQFTFSGAVKGFGRLSALQLRTSTLHIPNCHGLGWLGLVERFGKTHPEYFALKANGTRWNGAVKLGNPNNDNGHICFSSGEMKDILLKDAEALLTGKPASATGAQNGHGKVAWGFPHRKPFFNLMPNDGMPPCLCSKCKPFFKNHQLSSNFMWRYFTSFAKTLKERKVPGYVTCMAYANYNMIPDCDIPDNIIVQLALTGPYNELLASQKRDDKLLIEWNKKLGSKPYLWLYPSKCRAAVGWVPNSAPRAVGAYLKRQAPYCFGAFLESETDIWLFGFLNYYVAAKVMWNSSADVDALLDEHFKLMYGPAAPVMQKIFDNFEKIWLEKICGNCVDTPVGPKGVVPSQTEIWTRIYNTATLNMINAEFDRAEKLAASDKKALKRVKFIRAEFWKPVLTGMERFRKSSEINDESVIAEMKSGEKITIDGKLNEPAWKNAPAVWLRERKKGVNSVATRVSMLRDKDYFYFGFFCQEPETANITAVKRQHDDNLLWQDNCVELYLDTRGDRKEYYQIMLNSQNSVSDLHVAPGITDWKWNSNALSAVSVQPGKSWCAEIRIPRSAMAQAKDKVNADFTRLRTLKNKTEYYNWIKLPPRNKVEQLGILYFTAPENRNLLKDQDFQGKVGYAGRFIGPWAAHKTIHRDTSVFRFGGSSCRMGDGCHTVQQNFKGLKTNTRYRFSYFIKLENLSIPGLYVRVFEGNGRVHTLPRVFPKGTAPWHKLEFTFKTGSTPPKNGISQIYFVLLKSTGRVWIDRVKIEEIR